MKKYEIFTLISLAIVIAIPIILNIFVFDNQSESTEEPPQEDTDNGNNNDGNENDDGNGNDNGNSNGDGNGSDDESDQNNGDSNEVVWGVDSASYTDENLYSCVIDNFGEPEVWGRYLGERDGVSAGLDTDEVNYLHDNDIQILVIYNHVNDARGYDHGVEHAEQAIQFAEDLDIPEGVAIFGDIEPDYPIDSEFMEGWYATLADSVYETGIYGVFDEGSELFEAYNAMEAETQENTIVWTAYPQEEITSKENAPEFNPQGPESSMLYGWQYAIDAETCNIDTNLFRGEMMDYLW